MQSVYKDSMLSAITSQVKKIWNTYDLQPNFDIYDLVKKLGGTIEPDEEERLNDYEEAEIIESLDNRSFKILYNYRMICEEEASIEKHLENPRVRYAIAHEIGHLFLHMLKPEGDNNIWFIKGDYKRNIKDSSLIEWEAETFATEFLMPERVFRIYHERFELICGSNFDDIVAKLAGVFGTPYNEIIKRGRQLELWN